MHSVHVRKPIYLLPPYMGMFFKRDLMPAKVWSCLRGAIGNAGAEVYCQIIIDRVRVAFTQNSGDNQPLPLNIS